MITIRNILVTACIVLTPPVYAAVDPHQVAAERLLKAMDMEKFMDNFQERLLNQQLHFQPCSKLIEPVIKKFYTENLSWEKLKGNFLALYVKEFKESDLNDIAKFYESAIGKAAMEKLPKLTSEGIENSMKGLQSKQAALKIEVDAAYGKLDPKEVSEECRSHIPDKAKK